MISLSANIDQASLANLDKQIKAYTATTRRSIRAGVSYAAVLVAQSMRAQTKSAPKRRRVYKNPDGAGYGVYTYPAGTKTFTPITRNVSRVRRRVNGQILYHDKTTRVFKPESRAHELASMTIQEARRAKITNITNAGLCKRLWQTMARPGAAVYSHRRKGAIGQKTEGYVGLDGYRVNMHNALSYAVDALKGGRQSVDTAVKNATAQMRRRIEHNLMKL